MRHVLYIHGMGGGSDSRIPSILREELKGRADDVDVVVRTYDFDPETATVQIDSWVEELEPVLVIGESLGALHAIRLKGIPHLFVSPALNASYYFELLAWLTLIPGVTWIFDRIYRPKEGDRQPLHFIFPTLRKYMSHRRRSLENSSLSGNTDLFHAFFGTSDHYRRSGIVSLKTWEKYFGKTYDVYEGSHFMEDEHVRSLLVAKLLGVLNNNK